MVEQQPGTGTQNARPKSGTGEKPVVPPRLGWPLKKNPAMLRRESQPHSLRVRRQARYPLPW